MIIIKMIVLVLTLLPAVLLLGGCSSQKDAINDNGKPVIEIAYLPITHSLPLLVAYEQTGGEFENFTLDLIRFSSWADLTEAFNANQITGAVTMFEIALANAQRGMPAEIQLLTHRNGDVLVAANDIKDVSELKGKTLATPHRLSGHTIYLYLALQEYGISLEAVNIIEMPPPEMPAALSRGEISGYVVAEPFGAQSVVAGTGSVLLRAQDVWPNWICCGLVMHPEFNEKYPEANKELIKALIEAGQFIEENKKEAISIAGRTMDIREELWELSLDWISYDNLIPHKEEFEKLQNILIELPWEGDSHTLLREKIDLNKIINLSLTEAVLK